MTITLSECDDHNDDNKINDNDHNDHTNQDAGDDDDRNDDGQDDLHGSDGPGVVHKTCAFAIVASGSSLDSIALHTIVFFLSYCTALQDIPMQDISLHMSQL